MKERSLLRELALGHPDGVSSHLQCRKTLPSLGVPELDWLLTVFTS